MKRNIQQRWKEFGAKRLPVIRTRWLSAPNLRDKPLSAMPRGAYVSAPGMGNNLVVKVHYRLGSRNC